MENDKSNEGPAYQLQVFLIACKLIYEWMKKKLKFTRRQEFIENKQTSETYITKLIC